MALIVSLIKHDIESRMPIETYYIAINHYCNYIIIIINTEKTMHWSGLILFVLLTSFLKIQATKPTLAVPTVSALKLLP